MNVIDQLEAEWPGLVGSATMRTALARWRSEDPRLDFPSLEALVAYTEQRDRPREADHVLAALARRARSDHEAARVLLQVLLPGCKALARRWRTRECHDERVGLIVALTYDRIRTYPYERRPARIAANVLLDVHQRLYRGLAPRADTLPLEVAPEPVGDVGAEPEPAREVVSILGRAVRAGLLDPDSARLIALTRVAGVPVAELAREQGLSEQTLRRRRLRAEQRLREGVAA